MKSFLFCGRGSRGDWQALLPSRNLLISEMSGEVVEQSGRADGFSVDQTVCHLRMRGLVAQTPMLLTLISVVFRLLNFNSRAQHALVLNLVRLQLMQLGYESFNFGTSRGPVARRAPRSRQVLIKLVTF